jgi:hypothetical protein
MDGIVTAWKDGQPFGAKESTMKTEKEILQDELTYYYRERKQLQSNIANKKSELRFLLDREDHLRKCTLQRITDMQLNLDKIKDRIKKREMELTKWK